MRVCVSQCLSVPEVDDLAQYLDQLLAVPEETQKISKYEGGLNRFRAAANKTLEMVSLVHKARQLDIHSRGPSCLDVCLCCSSSATVLICL